MHLFLVRHGESYVNLPDWTGGPVDAGLTDLGQQQAEQVARWLAGYLPEPTALFASTMKRARETAAAIAAAYGDLPVQHDDRIREIGNCWPDATSINIDAEPPEFADHWASERPYIPIAKDGETWGDFVTRVGRFLYEVVEALPEPDQEAIVVCHGGVINAVLDVVFNVGHWRTLDAWVQNTGIMHLEYDSPRRRQEIWRLHGANMKYHLVDGDGVVPGYPFKAK